MKSLKRHELIEPGDDDCGDAISGLGPDAVLRSCDASVEAIDRGDEHDLFVTMPATVQENTTNVYSAMAGTARLIYVNICRGEGRISQVAPQRGLTSGGDLGLATGCDIDAPMTQKGNSRYTEKLDLQARRFAPASLGRYSPQSARLWRFCLRANLLATGLTTSHHGQTSDQRNPS